jgi:hypothetical protein
MGFGGLAIIVDAYICRLVLAVFGLGCGCRRLSVGDLGWWHASDIHTGGFGFLLLHDMGVNIF